MSLSAGMRLGSYEIVGLVGAGGMGEVYRARDTRLDRIVAIKALPETLATDPQFRERFEREARVIAALTHPHICTLHDVGRENRTSFLVMEYLEGETLADRLEKGALPLDQALKTAIEIVQALDAAHSAGIVHRDLKPANVFLVRSGGAALPTAKLLDFGLAKARGPAVSGTTGSLAPTTPPNLTVVGTMLGTSHYMAPEQLEGKDADHRADIWGFGCILYEMLTGKKAFEGSSLASLIASILGQEPIPVSKIQHLTPPLLDHLVRRALAKDPDDRWQSARDVRAELEWIREHGRQSHEAMQSGGTTRSKLGLAWGVAAVCAAAALVASLLYIRTSQPADRLIKLSFQPSDGTTFDTIAVSPDGRLVAFTAIDASGKIGLWLRALDSLGARRLPQTEGAAFPFWSPDSAYIGYSTQGLLHKIAVSGGPPQTICQGPATRGATWGRNGVIVFTRESLGPLLRVAADGGEPTVLTTLDASRLEASHRWPLFLPDGRHYLFTIRSGQPDVRGIYVGALDSPERTRLVGDLSNAAYAATPSGLSYLLFGRGRSLLAQRFDVDRLRVTGEPIVVADNVEYSNGWSYAAYSVSENGILVYDSFSRSRDIQLTWFDRTGTRRGTVGEFYPAKVSLSPNETRVALDSIDPQAGTLRLWTVDLVRGVSSRVGSGRDDERSPIWSPDGTRITFAADGILVERNSTGAGEKSVLLKSDGLMVPRDWSRDGRFLLYARFDSKTKWDLWVLPVSPEKAQKPFPFAVNTFNEDNGVFSPDGKWIAYDSDQSGTREIFVQAFSPRSAGFGGRYQVSKGGGRYPQWRRDGKELFYLAADSSKLMAVPMPTRTTFEVGVPKPLFEGRLNTGITPSFAATSDGQRFLLPVPIATEGSSPATVVVNWTAALKK
jgi:serine/threonine protein kinase